MQYGSSDRMGRLIPGLFEILIDEDKINDQMEQAYRNNSKMSCNGALVVIYRNCSPGQAEYLVKQNDAKQATSGERRGNLEAKTNGGVDNSHD